MKLLVAATWTGCPKNQGSDHLAEKSILEGTLIQLTRAMTAEPLALWSKREFTCKYCGRSATVAPTGTYIVE